MECFMGYVFRGADSIALGEVGMDGKKWNRGYNIFNSLSLIVCAHDAIEGGSLEVLGSNPAACVTFDAFRSKFRFFFFST